MRGEPMNTLPPDQLGLLRSVVERHRSDLLPLIDRREDLTRSEAEDLVNAIGEEVSRVADEDDWSPDSYGSKLEQLLDVINRHRMP